MKKRIFIQIKFIIIILLLFVSCTEEDTDITPQVDLDFPVDWFKEFIPDNIIVLQGISPLSGTDDQFQENMNVSQEYRSGLDLQNYYDLNVANLDELPDYEFVSSVDTNINGMDSKKLIFSAFLNNNDFTFMDFIFYENNYGYVITCTALDTTFSEYKPVFEDIVSTFQITY